MDEEAEDRLTELARSRLDDTLSEAARLLSGPSSDAAPARRTERLGIDEVLLGLSRHPGLGLVPDPGPPASGEPLPEHGSSHASPDAAAALGPDREGQQDHKEDGRLDAQGTAADAPGTTATGVPGRPTGLRTEVDQLRADVETARRRVEAAEARAEEHEAALEDLRKALGRLRHAGVHPPHYERPSFASVVIGEPEASPAPLPVVAFSLGTVPSSPTVLHAAKLGSALPGPITTLTAQLVEDDHTGPSPSDASAPPPGSAQPALPPAGADTADEGGGDPAPPEPAPTRSGPSEPSEPSGPTDEANAGATARLGRRRFWQRW